MAGLFGFFGKKKDVAPTEINENGNGSQAFFLDADSAKTLGDIEYMRTPKTVRRTFPKTAGNGGEFESTKIVSAMGEMNGSQPSMNGSKPAETSNSTGEVVEERRRTDTSMEMFRNMAKDLKKR